MNSTDRIHCIDYDKSLLGIGYALLSLELQNKSTTIR